MDERRLFEIAKAEYEGICRDCKMAPVARFLLYEPVDGATDEVGRYDIAGTNGAVLTKIVPRRNMDPLYRPGLLLLPVAGSDLTDVPDEQPELPPTNLNWKRWRGDLWHEVCHQYQDVILGKWNPADGAGGHLEGWDDALVGIAQRWLERDEDFRGFVDAIWGPAERVLLYPGEPTREWQYPTFKLLRP